MNEAATATEILFLIAADQHYTPGTASLLRELSTEKITPQQVHDTVVRYAYANLHRDLSKLGKHGFKSRQDVLALDSEDNDVPVHIQRTIFLLQDLFRQGADDSGLFTLPDYRVDTVHEPKAETAPAGKERVTYFCVPHGETEMCRSFQGPHTASEGFTPKGLLEQYFKQHPNLKGRDGYTITSLMPHTGVWHATRAGRGGAR